MTTTDRPITAGRESILPPITLLAEEIRGGRTVESICDEHGVSRSTLQGRFSTAGYAMSTGEKQAKRGGAHQPLESVQLGTGGVYIGGRDWTNGLPTPDAPARHQSRAKHTGLPWDQIQADYTARGGQVDADVWPKAGGTVHVIGGEGTSRVRVHSWVEADEYSEPTESPAKPRGTTASLNREQAAQVCTRHESGASIRDLCVEFNVSHTAIQTALRNGGIQTRARGGANGSRSRS